MKRELICIGCPMGCYLTVDYTEEKINNISGNRCKIGAQYAEKEFSNPERNLTTTVKVKNGQLPLASVKTNKPIAKNKLFEAMAFLSKVEIEAPIIIGQIVVQNLLDTGIDIVATKNVTVKKFNI